MKKITYILITLFIAVVSSCSNGKAEKTNLAPKDFQAKIKSTESAVVIDVRTADEFSTGHLMNALNMDWNDAATEAQLKSLDQSKTYFVYCLSGGRSSGAARFLRSNGFKNVIELNGGMMAWRSEGLEEESAIVANAGMSLEDYQALLKSDKTVVIDIFAEWCGPCKKMSPYLTEMQNTMSDKVTIIRIDADKNPDLCKTLGVNALPTIFVYKANQKTFEHIGFLGKDELLKEL
jgi:thioredoxin